MTFIARSTADNLVSLHFAIGVRGHSCFYHNIIKVLGTIPVSATILPKCDRKCGRNRKLPRSIHVCHTHTHTGPPPPHTHTHV